MAKHDMSDHVYDNTNWMKKDSFGIRKPAKEKQCRSVCAKVLVVLLILSLLVNGVLAYLCVTKYKNVQLHCEPGTNCSNSDHDRGSPGCTYDENWRSINYCPDLPEQWYKGNGIFYVFSSHNKTWNSSRKYCQDLGGDLVIINNTEEKEFLAQRLCVAGESDLYWAGNWPDLNPKANCAVLKGNTQEHIHCSREEKSICEIPCLL
ncbi:killer cell lectin-like receptor subfamily G member 1 [Carassius carassius]|uniref:killer cell lectin-like receptor subfamily G member 1 n=1 Tax=Carassius carassius TaxID=217509 RepID=UPI00286961ED|nr:killer cell lectin-like receptor subfamily G member 1 [Carassius carassius]